MHRLTCKLEDKILVVSREGENTSIRVDLETLEADVR